MKIFISYSREDKVWKDRLLKHLVPLQKNGILDIWEDSRITLGDNWDPAIEKAINEADVAILLISSDFLSSEYIQKQELPMLLKRREQENMLLCPLLIEPCPWKRVNWLNNIQKWPINVQALAGHKTAHEIKECLVGFIEAVCEAFDKKNADRDNGLEKKNDPAQIEKGLAKPNLPIKPNRKQEQKEDNEPERVEAMSQRVRLLIRIFFGMLGGAFFAVVLWGIFRKGASDFNVDLKAVLPFNSFIWAVIGAFYADREDYQNYVVVGFALGFGAWILLDGVFTGFEGSFMYRAVLFGTGAGAFLGVLTKWVLRTRLWLPILVGLTFVLFSTIIYYTLIDKSNGINHPCVWCGDWIHWETWGETTVSEGTMTLRPGEPNTGNISTINGSAYSMLHHRCAINGKLKNDGQILVGEWKNNETGKTGTFEWHHVPPESFRGYFTIQGNVGKYPWRGNKFTSDFKYLISDEIKADIDTLNLRTIFLSQDFLSKMKIDKAFERKVDKATIITVLKKKQPLHILETVENNVLKIGRWYKVLTRIDNGDLRKGYIAARFNNYSTIKLKGRKD